jgi:hypothetical protein
VVGKSSVFLVLCHKTLKDVLSRLKQDMGNILKNYHANHPGKKNTKYP